MRVLFSVCFALAAFTHSVSAQSFLPAVWMGKCFAHFDAAEDPVVSYYYETRCATYPAEMCAFVQDPVACYESFASALKTEADRLINELPSFIQGEGTTIDGLNETLTRARDMRYDGLCDAVLKGAFESERVHMPDVISYGDYCALKEASVRVNELRYIRGQLTLLDSAK
ncbi:MAG: hypothetical protein AAF340_05645 [Pseudomonadota bacterium]